MLYDYSFFDTLEIKVKYTGCLEFSGDYHLSDVLTFSSTHSLSWFICFNLEDYVAKHIYDADLVYSVRDFSFAHFDVLRPIFPSFTNNNINFYDYGDWNEDIPLTLRDTDIGTYYGTLFDWVEFDYKWNRISSSKEFLDNCEDQTINLNDEAKKAIKESQWVFSFLETDVKTVRIPTVGTYIYSKDIADITVLRIRFLNSDGNTYNLGVVSDRVNPDNIIDGHNMLVADDFWKKFIIIIASICILILIFKIVDSFDYKKKKSNSSKNKKKKKTKGTKKKNKKPK